ncbi:putative Ig domain-containing protein [Pseudoalteromonas rubra]|nr:putative Ig domain-containing protein [Pseudoalteromonas rubra]
MKRKLISSLTMLLSVTILTPLQAKEDSVLTAASHYSAYIFSDFTAGSGHAEGGLAVGGDLSLNGYGLATHAATLTAGYGLLVEGNATFDNGRLYHGQVRVAGEVNFAYPVLSGLPAGTEIENQPLDTSIIDSKPHFQAVSTQLSEATANGTVEFKWGGLYLKGDCHSDTQVFTLDGSQTNVAHTFDVQCIPDNATVIFNVSGDSVVFKNKSLATLLPHRSRTIFNFYQATALSIAGISIEGVVLAPNADIEAPHGDAQATVIANSWHGSMHLGSVRFQGDLSDLVSFNKAPIIVSDPNISVQWPDTYRYAVVAQDADRDPISYQLELAPQGAQINEWTGLIGWETEQVTPGHYSFTVRAADDKAAFDVQSFVVTVNAPDNYAPVITSVPPTLADINTRYEYPVMATDADGDTLSYRLIQAPVGMQINAQSGEITWPVGAAQTGTHLIVVRVTDGQASDTQSFNIQVSAPGNQAPMITSVPITEAILGVHYQYAVIAQDPDQDPIKFELIDGPEGMQIHPQTGLLDWVGEQSQLGEHSVTVQVTDLPGLSGIQQFIVRLTTQGNRAPEITSQAVELVDEFQDYHYPVSATDDRDQQLSYVLTQSPTGMSIDPNNGLVAWPAPELLPQGRLADNPYCRIVQDKTTRVSGAADIFLVVDESGSMSGEHRWMDDLVPALEAGLRDVGVGNAYSNLYGLVGYEARPSYKTYLEQYVVEADSFTELSRQLRLYGGTEDGYRAMSETLDTYPLRDETAHNLILVTDEDRDNTLALDINGMLVRLQESNVILNAVVNATFQCGDGTSAIGIAANGVGYVADGQGDYYTCENATATSGYGTTVSDYVDLAILTGGAAWDLNFLRAGGLRASSFSKALVDIKVKEIVDQLPPILQSDLQPNLLSVKQNPSGALTLSVTLRNRGLTVSLDDAVVAFYSNDQLLGQVSPGVVEVGAMTSVQLSDLAPQAINGKVRVVVATASDECVSNNNVLEAYVAQVTVADSEGLTDSQWFAVNVQDINAAPEIAQVAPVTLEVGERYSQTLAVSDPDLGEGLLFSLVNKPQAMEINPSSGVITWRPGQADVGPHLIEAAIEDLAGEVVTTQFEVTVLDFLRAPIISSTPVRDAQVGASYYYQVVAGSDRGAALTYKLALAPEGMTIDAQTGEVVWRPDMASTEAGHEVIIEVIDDKNLAAIQSFNLVVRSTGVAPEFTSVPSTFMALGDTFSYQIQVSTSDGVPATLALISAPQEMVLNVQTSTVSWTPIQSGVYAVAIAATSEGGVTTVQAFELQVSESINQPPVITSSAQFVGADDGSLQYQVEASDPEGSALTYQLAEAPEGMTVGPQGLLVWPQSAQIDGLHTVRVRAIDEQGIFAEQHFTFSYYPSNQAPGFTSTPVGIAAVDVLYSYKLSATDPDGDPIYFSLLSAPEGAVLDANNELLWTPDAASLGSQQFEILAEDALGAGVTQRFSVLVRALANNHPPVIHTSPDFSAFVGQTYLYQIGATDEDGHQLLYRLGDVPQGVTLSAQGLLSWTPTLAQAGAQSITVRVIDEYGAYVQQQFNVSVNAGDKPAFTSQPVLSGYSGLDYLYPLSAQDLDGDSLTFELLDGPAGMQLDTQNQLTWQPDVADLGVHTVQVRVSDPVGNHSEQQFNLTIRYQGDSQPPVITSEPPGRAKTDEVYRYALTAQDPDGDSLIYQLQSAPQGMAVDALGVITWQPQTTQVGIHSVTVSVRDITGQSVSQQFNIAVTAPGPFNRRKCR